MIETVTLNRAWISESALVLAGELTDSQWMKSTLLRYNKIAAADGGSDHLKKIGFSPAIWIGDGDTVKDMPGPEIERIRLPVNKDLSDGEAAVNLLTNRFINVDIFCGLGGKYEHHHATLALLLVRPGRVIVREKGLMIVAVDPSVRLHIDNMQNAIVSVFAGSDRVITDMDGFQWELTNEELVPYTRGLLNVVTKSSAWISPREGKVFVYIRWNEVE